MISFHNMHKTAWGTPRSVPVDDFRGPTTGAKSSSVEKSGYGDGALHDTLSVDVRMQQ